MKKRHLFPLLFIILVLCIGLKIYEYYTQPIKKTVFIIIDGVPADVMERVSTPSIDSIAEQGGYTTAETGGLIGGYSQTPTISAVGYNNLLTATWANKHNVWGNDISAPNYHYWNIFRIAKNQKTPAKTAVFSGWEENRTKLIGDKLSSAGNITVDYFLDGLDKDEKNYPKEEKNMHIFKIDEKVTDAAAECIINQGPDLTWLYLWYMDDAGHLTGTGEYFDEYLVKADAQVERIIQAIKKRQSVHNEDWLIIVTSDHGRSAPSGHGHGGQSERERSIWISMNQAPNEYFTRESLNDITDITPTICRFMNWEVPDSIAYEWDGIPLIGKVDISNPRAKKENNGIVLEWDAYSDQPISIWVSTTNEFAKGGHDSWVQLATVPASEKQFIFTPNSDNQSFFKFSLRGKNNHATVWIKDQPKKEEPAQPQKSQSL